MENTGFFVNSTLWNFSVVLHSSGVVLADTQDYPVDFTFFVEKGHLLALMLVVISLTTSAKAGSERICFSTLSSECSTVV